MPHLIIEHSAKGTNAPQLEALCKSLYDYFAAHPLVPRPETLKIRTLAVQHYYLASGHDSFAHAHIYILAGRSDADKKELSELACTVMGAGLPDVGHFSADCLDLSAGYHKLARTPLAP